MLTTTIDRHWFCCSGGLSFVYIPLPNYIAALVTNLADRSSVASVRSTIYEHVEENGRTYNRFQEGSKCSKSPTIKTKSLCSLDRISITEWWGQSIKCTKYLSESSSNLACWWKIERARKTRCASAFQFDIRAKVVTDLQHALMGVTLEGKLHLAPIGPNPQHVRDIETGEKW